mmetsp:Transcript_4043/g.8964  ORF Transcript_4043/g.8964 Transcript_4043/m.8964 type:complete len:159 (+) Transcript_4043:250-726(+)
MADIGEPLEEGLEIGQEGDFTMVSKSVNDTMESADEISLPHSNVAGDDDPSGRRSSCLQSRRNKIIAIMAAVAVLAIAGLSSALVLQNNKNNGSNNDGGETQVTAAMMEVTDEADISTPSPMTSKPTSRPTLPPAGSISNDFELDDNGDGGRRRLGRR